MNFSCGSSRFMTHPCYPERHSLPKGLVHHLLCQDLDLSADDPNLCAKINERWKAAHPGDPIFKPKISLSSKQLRTLCKKASAVVGEDLTAMNPSVRHHRRFRRGEA